MKFWLERTSQYFSTDKPPLCCHCHRLSVGKRLRHDWRTFKSFDDYEQLLGQEFTAEGFDHKVMDDRIRRSFLDDGWFIELESLEELAQLIDEVGDVVMAKDPDGLKLEIYDDYRE